MDPEEFFFKMVYPEALILLCMSASPGTPTDRVCASVRSWRSEKNVTPKGSHLYPVSPSSLIPPLLSVPAGISLFSSGEMSDLFHHPSHRGRPQPCIHPTSVKLHKSASFLDIRAELSIIHSWIQMSPTRLQTHCLFVWKQNPVGKLISAGQNINSEKTKHIMRTPGITTDHPK